MKLCKFTTLFSSLRRACFYLFNEAKFSEHLVCLTIFDTEIGGTTVKLSGSGYQSQDESSLLKWIFIVKWFIYPRLTLDEVSGVQKRTRLCLRPQTPRHHEKNVPVFFCYVHAVKIIIGVDMANIYHKYL